MLDGVRDVADEHEGIVGVLHHGCGMRVSRI